MTKLVLLRHGQSVWNLENRFTGWADVNLSSKGKEEASKAGFILKEKNYKFDIAFSSYLKRAIKTLNIVLEEMNLMWIPIYKSWRLNERHYGTLQGLNKDKTKEKYGKEQVHLWRRSYEVPPPPLERDIHNNNEKNLIHNEKYKELSEIPLAESLKMTSDRCLPYWHNEIAKKIKQGNKIIITAHGNSLRALVKHLDNISNKKILNINIPTGIPLVYELDNELKPLKHYYLNK